jgi:NTP pyrophosphatase (non-canonical NTP hydrolase)
MKGFLMIEIALILSVCVSLITLVSRHKLSVRHKALKVTLNRVAGERNAAQWRNRDLERSHQAAVDLAVKDGERTIGALTDRVQVWMLECFNSEIAADQIERNDRFIEEALELAQATGYPRERVVALVDYVYARPIGEPSQEVGGVMITLAAHCLAFGIDLERAAFTEAARIERPEVMSKIRDKQAAKPTGSALPA